MANAYRVPGLTWRQLIFRHKDTGEFVSYREGLDSDLCQEYGYEDTDAFEQERLASLAQDYPPRPTDNPPTWDDDNWQWVGEVPI